MFHPTITAAAADARRSDLYAQADRERMARAARESRPAPAGRSIRPRHPAAAPAFLGWLRRLRSKEAEDLA